MVLVIDNYDSFVFNLVQFLGALGAQTTVLRNDTIQVEGVERLRPSAIVISPGPRTPAEAGVSVQLVRRFAGRLPILGVCLGHQAIGAAYGAVVRRARRPMHGKRSSVYHQGVGCLAGIPSPFKACRYHSLVVEAATLPPELVVTAVSPDGEVMGLRHRDCFVEGLQFHPESIFTEHGMRIMANFLASVEEHRRSHRWGEQA